MNSNLIEYSIKIQNKKKFLILLQKMLYLVYLMDIMELYLHMDKQVQEKRSQLLEELKDMKIGELYPEVYSLYSKKYKKEQIANIQ